MIINEENLKRLEELAKKITKKQISIVLAGTVAITTPVILLKHKKNNKQTLYLMEMKNEENLSLYTKHKNDLKPEIAITNDMYVITDKEETFINNLYKSYIVNNKGEMQECYLKGKNIDFDIILDEINLPEDIKYERELDIVTPKDGSWMRKNKIIDRNTDNARLMKSGEYVIASAIGSTSKENDYYWKETICVDIDNKSFYSGYMVDGYLMNSDFKEAQGIKFETNGELNIRDIPSVNGNILSQLDKNQEVVLIPNLPSTTADNIDWFYVAYKNKNEKINFGYCAATEYGIDGTTIKYLKEIDNSFLKEKKYSKKRIDFSKYNDNKEKMIGKIVNLHGEAEHLKLRKKPGLDEKIVHYLDEGTYLYTYSSELEKKVSKDGYDWTKVYLIDGTEGYVAMKYIKDYEENINNEINNEINSDYQIQSENTNTYNFNNVHVNGYFGIDVNNTTDPSVFEKTITNNNYYEDDYPQMSQNRKIDFAIIKIGATADGSGPFQIINEGEYILENINSLINVCEKNRTPYGLYYYTQATTKEEADCEVDAIVNLLATLGIKSKNYIKLPLYMDIEQEDTYDNIPYDTRAKTSALINGKSYQTEILNYVMNKVREKTGMEVCLYTDHNTMDTTINFDELDEINKTNCWIVEVSEKHSNNLMTNEPSVYNYINMRQTEINRSIYIEETGDLISTDFDIMNEEYFNKHVR